MDIAIEKISNLLRMWVNVCTVLTGFSDCSKSTLAWYIQRSSNRAGNACYRASSRVTRLRVSFMVGERTFDRRCDR